ncbi:MAG TPA: glycosyltransferase family 39 protein, partial [Planctomycetota bacterium]|nr:glycosyltransferase family 39 protein [Planctomycetota bacterium]
MDALYHVEWARAWAEGRAFQPPPYFRAPLYPWFLGLVTELFGPGLLLPRLIQAGFGALGVLALWAAVRRVFDRRTALVASLLYATSWISIFYDGELLLESLAIPLYVAALALSLAVPGPRPVRTALSAGLVWGLSLITRPNPLLFLPFLALWLVRRPRAGWAAALALTAGTLVPVLPITAYNTLRGDDFVLIASQAGINLWIGNNPQSDGSTAIVPGTRADWWGGHRDAIQLAERAEGRALKPSEVSQHYSSRALRFVREEPGAWLGLMLRKLRLLVCNAELGNNEEPRYLFERFSPLGPLVWVGFGVLAPLAVVGLWLARRGAWTHFPLWGFLAVYSLGVLAFFVNARFRLPVVPLLCAYAAPALVAAAEAWRARRWGPLAAGTGVVLALAIASHALVPASAARLSPSNGRLVLAKGYADAGDWQAARAELQAALELAPDNLIARRSLAATLRALGEPAPAEGELRRVLAAAPRDADALDALADLLLEQGRAEEALPLAERLAGSEPGSARGPYAAGRAHFSRRDAPAAEAALREALTRDARHFGAAYALGVLLEGQSRAAEALEAFERALASPPPPDERFRIDTYARAIALCRNLGRSSRAQQLSAALEREHGAHPAARAVLDSL